MARTYGSVVTPCLPLQHPCTVCAFITIAPIGGQRMCDFTHSSVASTAEHSHVYGKTWREGSSNPLIYSTSDTVCHLSLSRSLSHSLLHPLKHTYLSVPYLLPPHASPSSFHPHSGSSCHHLSSSTTPEKPIQACSKPSWHVGQGRWSPFRFSATTSLLPSSPVAAPSLLLNISSTRLMYQQGS